MRFAPSARTQKTSVWMLTRRPDRCDLFQNRDRTSDQANPAAAGADEPAGACFGSAPHERPIDFVQQRNPANRVAAQSAMGKCQRTYSEQQANGVCELISMDDIPIATARQLLVKKARPPRSPVAFRNGEATVCLAGTVHILESLHPLPQQYEDAYYAAENLVFEVDLSRYHPAEVQQKTLNTRNCKSIVTPKSAGRHVSTTRSGGHALWHAGGPDAGF